MNSEVYKLPDLNMLYSELEALTDPSDIAKICCVDDFDAVKAIVAFLMHAP